MKKRKNKEKTKIIVELRQEHPDIKLCFWLKVASVPKSSYYEWVKKLSQSHYRDKELLKEIQRIIEETNGAYGYRRVSIELNNKVLVNHKRVLRIMRENGLLCKKFGRKNRRYISYKVEVGKVFGNKLNRKFTVDEPNKVWVNDVSEFILTYP